MEALRFHTILIRILLFGLRLGVDKRPELSLGARRGDAPVARKINLALQAHPGNFNFDNFAQFQAAPGSQARYEGNPDTFLHCHLDRLGVANLHDGIQHVERDAVLRLQLSHKIQGADNETSSKPDDSWGMPATSLARAMAGDAKPFLIDVRTPQEAKEAGYIEGSVDIPMRDLAKSLDKLPANKNAPIVAYCAVGQRGALAMTALRLLGYTNVNSLSGGLNGWIKANLPVTK